MLIATVLSPGGIGDKRAFCASNVYDFVHQLPEVIYMVRDSAN